MSLAAIAILGSSLLFTALLLVNEVRYAERLRVALNASADAICAGQPGDALRTIETALEGKA